MADTLAQEPKDIRAVLETGEGYDELVNVLLAMDDRRVAVVPEVIDLRPASPAVAERVRRILDLALSTPGILGSGARTSRPQNNEMQLTRSAP